MNENTPERAGIEGIETACPIVVRRPNRQDEPSARRLFERSIADAFAREGLIDAQDGIAYEISHKSALLRASLEAADTQGENAPTHPPGVPAQPFFLIAESAGEVVGTISFGPCGRKIRELSEGRLNEVGELGSLYVRPDRQNAGVASELIAALTEELRRRGIEEFCLDSGYGRAQRRWLRKFGPPYLAAEDHWGPGVPHLVWLCRVEDLAGR